MCIFYLYRTPHACTCAAPPAGGDELQGVKKGIVEVADAVVVNKCDGQMDGPARHAAAEYRRALSLVRPKHVQQQQQCASQQHGADDGGAAA
jgi:putative protein kinase ArgK-like GTPase of G3E family